MNDDTTPDLDDIARQVAGGVLTLANGDHPRWLATSDPVTEVLQANEVWRYATYLLRICAVYSGRTAEEITADYLDNVLAANSGDAA